MQNIFNDQSSAEWAEKPKFLKQVDPRQRAWLEVNQNAIEANAKTLKNYLSEECRLMAVVKADGYGHGAETVARAAIKGGACHLGVATLQEGIELREVGLTSPILILGNLTQGEELAACLHWDLMPTISNIREALLCQNIADGSGRKFQLHLKVDTGMTRLGCDLNEAGNLIKAIFACDNLELKGVYSHLALADSALVGEQQGKSVTLLQQQKFENVISNFISNKSICCHLANSAGTFLSHRLHYNMARVGLALYGYSPTPDSLGDLQLEPAMSVKARVSFIRNVPPDTGVGYGHIYKTKTSTRLAIVGIGYADGVSRALSGKIFALYQGVLIPQVGAIAMDQMAIDISNVPQMKVGDVVTILGKEGDQQITPHAWSHLSGSIPWEVLCGFKNRLSRLII
tara:strand:+ start:274 stop:1473 length:1200 start_codon:yes stop_codon:yes gene_type:complete